MPDRHCENGDFVVLQTARHAHTRCAQSDFTGPKYGSCVKSELSSVVIEHHHTAQLDAQNRRLREKLSFSLSKKGKKKSKKKLTHELWHIGTLASDVPTYKFYIPTESSDNSQIIDIISYE